VIATSASQVHFGILSVSSLLRRAPCPELYPSSSSTSLVQNSLGIPLPAATQWEILHEAAEHILPAYEPLIRQAVQGDVLHYSDTSIKILEWMGERAQEVALAKETADGTDKQSERTGLFTSGIVSSRAGQRIAPILSGRQ